MRYLVKVDVEMYCHKIIPLGGLNQVSKLINNYFDIYLL